jgi:hypothetical protein
VSHKLHNTLLTLVGNIRQCKCVAHAHERTKTNDQLKRQLLFSKSSSSSQTLSVRNITNTTHPWIMTDSRSDITGAIDYGLVPYLDPPPSSTPPTWSILPHFTVSQTSTQMSNLLSPHGIWVSLIGTLTSLSLFIQTLTLARQQSNLILSPEAFSNDLYTLEHQLLSTPLTLPSPAHEPAISVSLRYSALIYLKAVLQEFPHSVNGSNILVERVRGSLGCIWLVDGLREEKGKIALMTWMCTVCAAVARGEVRTWFVEKIGRTPYTSWNPVEMERLLCLKSTFGNGCIEKIWEEARAMSLE